MYRYLRHRSACMIRSLNKLIRLKFEISHTVEILHSTFRCEAGLFCTQPFYSICKLGRIIVTSGPHISNLFYLIVSTKSINKNSLAIISCVHSLDTIFRRRFNFFAACAKIEPRVPVRVLPIQTKFSSTLCEISDFSLIGRGRGIPHIY